MGAVAGVIVTLILANGAPGRDVDDITLGEGQTVNKEYGPIAANEPPVGILFGNTLRTPPTCRDSSYCDVIDLSIDVPPEYGAANFFKVDIELRWSNPTGTNNLNLYVHRVNGLQVLSSVGAGATQPERVTLQDPPEQKYFVVVSNAAGPNTGYRLTATFVPQGGLAEPDADDDFQFGGGSPGQADDDAAGDTSDLAVPGLGPAQSPLAAVFPPELAPPAGAVPSEGPRPVEQPGPDGPLATRALVALASTSPPPGSSDVPVVVSATMAALTLAGLAVFLFVRGRRETDF